MKKMYRYLFNAVLNSLKRIDIFKVYFFESIEICRKNKLYKHIKWNAKQEKEFNIFWEENYVKKISNRWHKLYQSVNGEFNVEYIPEILYSTKLEPKLNDYFKAKTLQDKSLCEIIFHDDSFSYSFPKTLLVRDGSYFYDSARNPLTKNSAIDLISSIESAIIKPTVGGSSGNGVKLLDNKALIDSITNNSDYYYSIIQKKLTQSKTISLLNESSINTFRVITYIANGKIHHAPISLRIGGGDCLLDNVHAGGMVIHVNNSGFLSKYAYVLGWGDSNKKLLEHPKSKVIFENYHIPQIKKIINAAYLAHKKLTGIGIVSWDIALDQNDFPIIIEANITGQSVWFPQMISGKSLFGENTKYMLELIK